MHYWAVLQLLGLVTIANGTPVVSKRMFGDRFAWPLDGNRKLIDGRPLFGTSKTVRGILLSVVVTSVCAPLVGLNVTIGFLVAVTAMAGDLLSSFLKRRLRWPRAVGRSGSIRFRSPCFRWSPPTTSWG